MPLIIGIVAVVIVLALIGAAIEAKERADRKASVRQFIFVVAVVAGMFFCPKVVVSGFLTLLAVIGLIVFLVIPPAGAFIEVLVALIYAISAMFTG